MPELHLVSPDFGIMVPQIVVFALAIILMALDVFLPESKHYVGLTVVSLLGYAGAMIALIWQDGQNSTTFYGMFRADGLTVFLSLAILVGAFFAVCVSASFVQNLEGRMPLGEFYVLLAFAILGAMLVAAAGDLVMVFVGIELSSLATYVLTAFAKRRTTSVEGALKYFLLGIFASAIFVYGMAWIYGATGSTNLDVIAKNLQSIVTGESHLQPSLLLAILLLIVGMGFKVAAVPFHMWTPDAYDGAPTPVTAYMSVVPKIAGFAAFVRILVEALGPVYHDWRDVIAALAFVTMLLGNIVAISQRNVKRMLAYSSIAHTGYILVGLASFQAIGSFSVGSSSANGEQGVSSLLYYLLAFAFMKVGAFGMVGWLQHRGMGMTLDDFSGLAGTDPLAAAAMAIFMLSLMGMPPLLGFYAKYYVILAAIRAHLLWLAVSIVVLSAVSAFYYLRVVAVMYFNSPQKIGRKVGTPLLNLGIAGMVVANIILGLFSSPVFDLAQHWSTALTVASRAVGF